MKDLLCKELRLAAHPTLFLFTAFGALVLVPNYPYSAVFLFGCLACMITFQYGRETNDVLFSALLPVTRGQIVAARLVTVCAMQLCQLVLSLPFAFLRVRLFPQGNAVGIEANAAFYGCMLLAYALFNLVYFSEFYRTAYRAGAAFFKAFLPVLVVIAAMETCAHLPATAFMDGVSADALVKQLPVTAAGLAAYLACNPLAWAIGTKRFRRVDL